MIKVIIFDFGGVILDLTKKQTYSAPHSLAILFEIPIEEAVSLWRDNRENLQLGRETPKEFLGRMTKQLNSNKSVNELYNQWTMLNTKERDHINWSLIAYIDELRKRYKVYVLSDTSNVAQDDPLNQEVKSHFDGFFVSYEEGLRKPDKAAFLNALNKIQARPEDCIFIDDTESNIQAAQALGIKSFSFATLEQLKEDLGTIGIV